MSTWELVSLSFCRVTLSWYQWMWSFLFFLSLSSLGILRENAPATDLFIFELIISGVGQESQLVSLCTYPALLMFFPFMLEKQSWSLPHVLALDLALLWWTGWLYYKVIQDTDLSCLLPSKEKYFFCYLIYYSLPECVFLGWVGRMDIFRL